MHKEKLFVYGTLRFGFRGRTHTLLAGESFIGHGTIKGTLYDLGSYPGVKLYGDGRVVGDLYCISNPDKVQELDQYEGISYGLYVRERVTVTTDEGEETKAWVYVYNRSVTKANRIPSGNYFDLVENAKPAEQIKNVS